MKILRTLTVAIVVWAAVPALAVYQDLDAIVAVVEEDVVLASELRTRFQQIVKQMTSQNMQIHCHDRGSFSNQLRSW